MPVVRPRGAASATVTQLLEPLNRSPPPNLPATRVVLESVPVSRFGEASAVVEPEASSNPYAATSPVTGSSTDAIGSRDSGAQAPTTSNQVNHVRVPWGFMVPESSYGAVLGRSDLGRLGDR